MDYFVLGFVKSVYSSLNAGELKELTEKKLDIIKEFNGILEKTVEKENYIKNVYSILLKALEKQRGKITKPKAFKLSSLKDKDYLDYLPNTDFIFKASPDKIKEQFKGNIVQIKGNSSLDQLIHSNMAKVDTFFLCYGNLNKNDKQSLNSALENIVVYMFFKDSENLSGFFKNLNSYKADNCKFTQEKLGNYTYWQHDFNLPQFELKFNFGFLQLSDNIIIAGTEKAVSKSISCYENKKGKLVNDKSKLELISSIKENAPEWFIYSSTATEERGQSDTFCRGIKNIVGDVEVKDRDILLSLNAEYFCLAGLVGDIGSNVLVQNALSALLGEGIYKPEVEYSADNGMSIKVKFNFENFLYKVKYEEFIQNLADLILANIQNKKAVKRALKTILILNDIKKAGTQKEIFGKTFDADFVLRKSGLKYGEDNILKASETLHYEYNLYSNLFSSKRYSIYYKKPEFFKEYYISGVDSEIRAVNGKIYSINQNGVRFSESITFDKEEHLDFFTAQLGSLVPLTGSYKGWRLSQDVFKVDNVKCFKITAGANNEADSNAAPLVEIYISAENWKVLNIISRPSSTTAMIYSQFKDYNKAVLPAEVIIFDPDKIGSGLIDIVEISSIEIDEKIKNDFFKNVNGVIPPLENYSEAEEIEREKTAISLKELIEKNRNAVDPRGILENAGSFEFIQNSKNKRLNLTLCYKAPDKIKMIMNGSVTCMNGSEAWLTMNGFPVNPDVQGIKKLLMEKLNSIQSIWNEYKLKRYILKLSGNMYKLGKSECYKVAAFNEKGKKQGILLFIDSKDCLIKEIVAYTYGLSDANGVEKQNNFVYKNIDGIKWPAEFTICVNKFTDTLIKEQTATQLKQDIFLNKKIEDDEFTKPEVNKAGKESGGQKHP